MIIELLIDNLSSKKEFDRIKDYLTSHSKEVKLGACIEDNLLMVECPDCIHDVCQKLKEIGVEVLGAAVLNHETVESMVKYHGSTYIH